MLLFTTLVSESRLNINDMLDCCSHCKCQVEVERNCHGFYREIVEDSVRIRFHFCNCGSTDQGGSLYICQDHLLWIATSRVVNIEDSLSAWSAKELCLTEECNLLQGFGRGCMSLGYPITFQLCLSSSDQWSD
jgi:hypothetical protein